MLSAVACRLKLLSYAEWQSSIIQLLIPPMVACHRATLANGVGKGRLLTFSLLFLFSESLGGGENFLVALLFISK